MIDVIVMEPAVLFRIKHFEQCCRRVSLEVASYLVDFVKHHHRIARAAFFQGAYDSSGH